MSEATAMNLSGAMAAPWTGVTLAELFASTVRLNGQSLAFSGIAPDGPVNLTFAQADHVVERIVERLEELIVEPGAPVALVMPCAVEAPLALIAVLRAGFMPCLLPVTLETETMKTALATCGARAVVTVGAIGAMRPAERVRSACIFEDGPRYVLAFGDRLPGGVIPLDGILHRAYDTAVRARPLPPRFSAPPIMTLATSNAWTHQDQEGLVATALALVLRANIASGEAMLSTLAPVTAAALSTGFVPALLTGGALHMTGVFSGADFVDQVEGAARPHVVVPASLEEPLARSGLLDGADIATAIIMHRPPLRLDAPGRAGKGATVFDALALGEHGLLLARRPPGGSPAIALGDMRIPDDAEGALVLASRLLADGQCEVSGAAAGIPVGPRPRATETEWTDTSITIECDAEGMVVSASLPDRRTRGPARTHSSP